MLYSYTNEVQNMNNEAYSNYYQARCDFYEYNGRVYKQDSKEITIKFQKILDNLKAAKLAHDVAVGNEKPYFDCFCRFLNKQLSAEEVFKEVVIPQKFFKSYTFPPEFEITYQKYNSRLAKLI